MPAKKQSKALSKVIYFDEGSVTDFLQIEAGGHLVQTTELLDNSTTAAEVGEKLKSRLVLVSFSNLFWV